MSKHEHEVYTENPEYDKADYCFMKPNYKSLNTGPKPDMSPGPNDELTWQIDWCGETTKEVRGNRGGQVVKILVPLDLMRDEITEAVRKAFDKIDRV